ncbi:MAG: hypothetical protein QME96_13900, partial [Myxococcota bacterium]|nr:hypothetical protein [Myxococcota bacterium]
AVATAAVAPLAIFAAGRHVPATSLWGAVAAAILLHRIVGAAADTDRSGARAAACIAGSVRAFVAALAALVPLTAVAALALWSSAASTVAGAVSAQGAAPWQWSAMRDPFALAVVALAAARLGGGFRSGSHPLRTVLDVVVTAAGSIFLAIFCFGGWNAGPFADHLFAWMPVEAAVLLAKCAAIGAALVWYGRRRSAAGRDGRAAGVAWMAALPLATASVAAAESLSAEWADAVLGPATGAALATIALGIWLRYRRRSGPSIVELRVEPA